MSEIINIEERRLGKLSDDELLVEALERTSKQIFSHSTLIKDLNERLEYLEAKVLPLGTVKGFD